MIQKDYIMRMLESFIQVMARVLFNKEIKNYQNAYYEISRAGQMMTGFTLDQIKALTGEDVKLLFDLKKESEVMKIIYAAKLLREEGMILEEENRIDDSLNSFSKAMEFFNLIPDVPVYKKHMLNDVQFLKQKIN